MATSKARRERSRRARWTPAARRSARSSTPRTGIPDAIRLEIGEPSFHTPRFVVDAAFEAAADGHTGYTPNGGYASLREALAAKIERVDGFAVDPEAVVVTPGAMNALFSIYLALLEPGDEVLLPTPGFPNMDEMVRLLGGEPVFYRLERDARLPPVARAARAARHVANEGDLRQHARQPDRRGVPRRDGARAGRARRRARRLARSPTRCTTS